MTIRWSGAWLLIAAVSLALSSCGSADVQSPKTSASPPREQVNWKRIQSDATFRDIEAINSEAPPPHLTAAGVKDQKPFVAYIEQGHLKEILFRSNGARGSGLRAITDDGANYAVTDVTDPTSGRPAHMWQGYSDPPDSDVISPTIEAEALRTSEGLQPQWLSPLFTSEGFGVVGVVLEDQRWRVHAWQLDIKTTQLDDSQLYLDKPPSVDQPLTGSTESSMLVAGDVNDGGADTSRAPQLWTIDFAYGPGVTSKWTARPLSPAPDELTDIAAWDVGWLLAGHKNLAPVVYDFDRGHGESIDMPVTRLDPENPGVFVDFGAGESPILATQSVGGSKVWFAIDDQWRDIDAPDGLLQDFGRAGDQFYLLVDGSIWHARVPDELLRAISRD